MVIKEEIKEDLNRAKEAYESAERNLKEDDILTTANRSFVSCENSVYILSKSKFGSSPISRIRILTRLKEIDKEAKETYDESYDLRVQANYGKEAKITPLNRENVEKSLEKVRKLLSKAEKLAINIKSDTK